MATQHSTGTSQRFVLHQQIIRIICRQCKNTNCSSSQGLDQGMQNPDLFEVEGTRNLDTTPISVAPNFAWNIFFGAHDRQFIGRSSHREKNPRVRPSRKFAVCIQAADRESIFQYSQLQSSHSHNL